MQHRTNRLSWILALAVALPLSGCMDEGPQGPGVALAALTPCDQNWNGSFPTDTDRVVVRVPEGTIGGEVMASFTEEDLWGTQNQLVVSGVTTGDDMTVEVYGCDGTTVTWAGVTPQVAVQAHHKTSVPVFLTAVGDLNCAFAYGGRDLDNQHVRAATYDDGGGVWLMGGFWDYQLTQGQKPPGKLYATQNVHRYVRATRDFENEHSLEVARGGGLAQPLSDGRMRLFGGVKTLFLQVQKDGMPIFWPSEDVAVATEIYNPSSVESTTDSLLALPAMPATAILSDGVAIAVGGATFAGTCAVATVGGECPVAFSPAEAFSSAFTVFGVDVEDVDVGALGTPRFGAALADLGEGRVLAWGGGATLGAAAMGEVIDLQTLTAHPLEVEGASVMPQFASAVAIAPTAGGGLRVVIAGGADMTNEAGSVIFGAGATSRLQLVSISMEQLLAHVVDIDVPGPADFARAGASLHTMDASTDTLWWLGGLKNFQDNPGDPGLPSRMVRFGISGQADVTYTELEPALDLGVNFGAFGATAIDMSDGSWLVVGGLRSVGGQQDSVASGSTLVRYEADSTVCQGDWGE